MHAILRLSLAMSIALSPAAVSAAEPGAASPPTAAAPTPEKKPELTPEEMAEKEMRKACKIKVCSILASKDPQGEDVACDIVKTWREADITKMLGGRINWPWGKAVCDFKLALKREPLAKAMSEVSYEVALPSQTVRCSVVQKGGADPYAIEMSVAPKMKFENGKATEAAVNWGEASAPMLIYPLIYAGTGFDNSNNVLGPEVVRIINEFTTKKCAEVKAELPVAPN
jgi:hypothetical protein